MTEVVLWKICYLRHALTCIFKARSLGLGACWIHSAKQMFETSEGKELLKSLGINGDYEGIGNCILGYSAVKPIGEIKRKDNYIYYID